MGDLFAYFSKLRDFKLQLSIFLVCFVVVLLDQGGWFDVGQYFNSLIKFLLLVSGLAVVYSFLELCGRCVKVLAKVIMQRWREKQARQKLRKEIKGTVESLDVYELRVLREIRGHNAVRMKNYPCLSSLRRKGVVNVINASNYSSYVEFSGICKEFLENEGWQRFGEYKRVAAHRVFSVMPHAELKAFRPFVNKAMDVAPRNGGRFNAPPSFKVYNRYVDSSIFSRVELNKSYHMDEESREALIDVVRNTL
ncbi:hypothetical protein [Chromohalobacter israelensis]|uniref:hypothetical protein n=1 Tax=Chromohalobacter israelensis TaxID=141390 RepID=UPI0015C425F1|nr:hypothetical protein [Chromohalobacter salexigens]